MEHSIRLLLISLGQSKMFQLVVILIVMDVIFGSLRAIRQKKFNSSVGIDGTIRKAGMLISLIFLLAIDSLIHFDLIGFIPDSVMQYVPIQEIGIMEFFALVYSIYEVMSVLKNMTLSGLPVKKLWQAVQRFLLANTDELLCMEENQEDEDDKSE